MNMKYFIFFTIIISSSVSFAYINETYDCKMKNFIGIDKDGMPKNGENNDFHSNGKMISQYNLAKVDILIT